MDPKKAKTLADYLENLRNYSKAAEAQAEKLGISIPVDKAAVKATLAANGANGTMADDGAPDKEAEGSKGYVDGEYIYVPWGVSSLSEYEAWRQSEANHNELKILVEAMSQIADGIFYDWEITDKPAALVSLASEFATMVQDMAADATKFVAPPAHPKIQRDLKGNLLNGRFGKHKPEILNKSQDGSVMLYKDANGDHYIYGIPTNRWRDRDYWSNPEKGGEIFTDASHIEFNQFLNDNPDQRPEFWIIHEDETAFKNRAIWHDYSDGFFHFVWPVDEDEVKFVTNYFDNYSAGMSHGFDALERDDPEGLITKYRMKEASLLPVDWAANVWASAYMITKGTGMAYTEEKRELLVNVFGSDWVNDAEKSNETLRTQLDEQGIDSKGKATGPKGQQKMEDEQVTPVVSAEGQEDSEGTGESTPETTPEGETPAATSGEAGAADESAIVKALTAMQGGFEKSIGELAQKIEGMEKRIAAVEGGVAEGQRKEGMTLAAFTQGLSGGKSVVGEDGAHVGSKEPLAKDNAGISTDWKGTHVLGGIFK